MWPSQRPNRSKLTLSRRPRPPGTGATAVQVEKNPGSGPRARSACPVVPIQATLRRSWNVQKTLLWFCCSACASLRARSAARLRRGERFRITVLGHAEENPRDCGEIETGLSFVLTAGPWVDDSCDWSGAVGTAPPFAPEAVYPECWPRGESQLGMECSGRMDQLSCGPAVGFDTGPKLTRSDRVIDDGRMTVGWYSEPGCASCGEVFSIRIEALDRQ